MPSTRPDPLATLLIALSFAAPTLAQGAAPPNTAPTSPAEAPAPAPREAAPAPPADVPPQVHPPTLLEFVDAEYPESARAAGLEGIVVLTLDIDAEGQVTAAAIASEPGHGLGAAAQSAALRFRFAPARRGETPMPSRIAYRYEFRLPPAPDVVPSAPPPAPSPPLLVAPDGAATGGASAAPEPDVVGRRPGAAAPGALGLDVTARGDAIADRLRQSAESVAVVETERAQRESADLGEVLARSAGVGVRRSGGLGSETRFSLQGLTDDQIRFFVDGLPLEYSGYPFGIGNVPVNLIERVEIYSGVVPVRFGADALGGAVNLVTEPARGARVAASYETGSFGVQRASALAQLASDTGLFARIDGFFDVADNDYPIDVEVPDDSGRLSNATVYRFHDDYRAFGGGVEVGVQRQPWAKRLSGRVFATDYDKDFQHNVVMTVPYGEVTYGETVVGGNVRYEHTFARSVSLETVAGYSYGRFHYLDVATCVYDWFGRCVTERTIPGEREGRPQDQLFWDHTGFARANASWLVADGHELRLAVAPSLSSRSGDERRQPDPSARDALSAQRELYTLVSGAEYELSLFDDALENIAFVKHYLQLARTEEPLPGNILRRRDRDTNRIGLGDGVRYRIIDGLLVKAGYEWATRLPRPDEVFGDAAFVQPSLELEPESSHNINLALELDALPTAAGSVRGQLDGFLRSADDLIVLLGSDRVQAYENVYSARSLGVEAAFGWTSPRDYVVLDANLTYQSFRNTSDEGTFVEFEGDRIPNRPWLFANASGRLQVAGVFAARDELALFGHLRYVHEFYRGWESFGQRQFKESVPSQLVPSAGITYLTEGDSGRLSSSLEVQNLSNEKVYDFFGVQRPGRAFYAKMAIEY